MRTGIFVCAATARMSPRRRADDEVDRVVYREERGDFVVPAGDELDRPSAIAPFIASTSAMFVWRAAEPPLRIAAFPLFKQRAAASGDTPGRAS